MGATETVVHYKKRRMATGAGVVALSAGIVGTVWAIVSNLDTYIGYGLVTIVIGLQALTLGYVLTLLSADWPPSIVFAAGQDAERRRAERERQRSRLASVTGLGDRAGGQT